MPHGYGSRPRMGFNGPPPGFVNSSGPPPSIPPLRMSEPVPLTELPKKNVDMYDPTDPTHGEDGDQSSGIYLRELIWNGSP